MLACAVTVARPEALVVAGEVVIVAVAPLAGAANVTEAFGTGLPSESFTSATSGAPKAVPTVVVWLFPLLTVIVAGAPTLFVSEKLADAATPVVDAVTE